MYVYVYMYIYIYMYIYMVVLLYNEQGETCFHGGISKQSRTFC